MAHWNSSDPIGFDEFKGAEHGAIPDRTPFPSGLAIPINDDGAAACRESWSGTPSWA
jgi:hypothetical protein